MIEFIANSIAIGFFGYILVWWICVPLRDALMSGGVPTPRKTKLPKRRRSIPALVRRLLPGGRSAKDAE